jgi:DtxR family Mn-dependent transcriptional regulator
MAQRHSIDEYLETIYFLAFPIGEYSPQSVGSPTLAARVAEMLGVSRASAGEMLKRLEKEGLIRRGEHKEALLTRTGRARAERVVRKHRIVERLLTDFMGYTAAEAHVYADDIGETFSDEMVERMEEKLGNPDRCPPGWPVDPAFEQAENNELAAHAELEPGKRATIVRLAEHVGVDVSLGGGVAHEVRQEPFDDPVLADNALGSGAARVGEQRLLVLAALDQTFALEPFQHLAGRRARHTEHLRDA